MPIEAFAPERNSGAMLSGTVHEDTTWQIFGGRDTDGFGKDTGDGDYVVTGRTTHALWNREGGEEVLHVGVSGSYRAGDDRIRTRPEAHLLDRIFDSNSSLPTRSTDGTVLYGAEAAWVQGPLSIQGEFLGASIAEFGGPTMPDVDFNGWYAFVSYFLTGESRNYKGGKFDRVKPKQNWDGGWNGAWEIAARYSDVDFNDTSTFTTDSYGLTLGLNWYLNPYARIMFNYVHNNVEDSGLGTDDDLDAFMMRFQVDW